MKCPFCHHEVLSHRASLWNISPATAKNTDWETIICDSCHRVFEFHSRLSVDVETRKPEHPRPGEYTVFLHHISENDIEFTIQGTRVSIPQFVLDSFRTGALVEGIDVSLVILEPYRDLVEADIALAKAWEKEMREREEEA